jgi:hypothetical protein
MTLSARSRPRALDAPAVLGRARLRFASRLREWVTSRFRHLARARALPGAVSVELALDRGERVLSVSRHADGGCALVATDRALYHRPGADGWTRLGWEQIARVGWDAAAGRLVIIGLPGVAPPRTVVPLHRRGSVPELAADRVTHTKLGRWHLLVAGTHRVLVEARRRPATGELLWVVVSGPDGGPDGDTGVGPGSGSGDDGIGRHVERAIARLGADVGLTQLPGTGLSGLPNAQLAPVEGC